MMASSPHKSYSFGTEQFSRNDTLDHTNDLACDTRNMQTLGEAASAVERRNVQLMLIDRSLQRLNETVSSYNNLTENNLSTCSLDHNSRRHHRNHSHTRIDKKPCLYLSARTYNLVHNGENIINGLSINDSSDFCANNSQLNQAGDTRDVHCRSCKCQHPITHHKYSPALSRSSHKYHPGIHSEHLNTDYDISMKFDNSSSNKIYQKWASENPKFIESNKKRSSCSSAKKVASSENVFYDSQYIYRNEQPFGSGDDIMNETSSRTSEVSDSGQGTTSYSSFNDLSSSSSNKQSNYSSLSRQSYQEFQISTPLTKPQTTRSNQMLAHCADIDKSRLQKNTINIDPKDPNKCLALRSTQGFIDELEGCDNDTFISKRYTRHDSKSNNRRSCSKQTNVTDYRSIYLPINEINASNCVRIISRSEVEALTDRSIRICSHIQVSCDNSGMYSPTESTGNVCQYCKHISPDSKIGRETKTDVCNYSVQSDYAKSKSYALPLENLNLQKGRLNNSVQNVRSEVGLLWHLKTVEEKADWLHRFHMLQKGMVGFKWAVQQSKRQELICLHRHKLMVMAVYFMKWRSFAEQNRKFREAADVKRLNLVKKAFDSWRIYVSQEKIKHRKNELARMQYKEASLRAHLKMWQISSENHRLADEFARMKMLGSVFTAWQQVVRTTHSQHIHDLCKSRQFRRTCLLQRHLQTWRNHLQYHQASKKADTRLKRKIFELWHLRYKRQLLMNSLQEAQMRREILSAAFNRWQSMILVWNEQEDIAVKTMELCRLRAVFSKWQKSAQSAIMIKPVLAKSQRKALARVFDAWRLLTLKRKKLEESVRTHRLHILERYLRNWRLRLILHQKEAELHCLVVRQRKRWVLCAWQLYVRRQRNAEYMRQITEQRVMRRALGLWRSKREEQRHAQDITTADKIRTYNLLSHCMKQWRANVNASIQQESDLARQIRRKHQQGLLHSALSQWKQQLNYYQNIRQFRFQKEKELLRKIVLAWHSFTSHSLETAVDSFSDSLRSQRTENENNNKLPAISSGNLQFGSRTVTCTSEQDSQQQQQQENQWNLIDIKRCDFSLCGYESTLTSNSHVRNKVKRSLFIDNNLNGKQYETLDTERHQKEFDSLGLCGSPEDSRNTKRVPYCADIAMEDKEVLAEELESAFKQDERHVGGCLKDKSFISEELFCEESYSDDFLSDLDFSGSDSTLSHVSSLSDTYNELDTDLMSSFNTIRYQEQFPETCNQHDEDQRLINPTNQQRHHGSHSIDEFDKKRYLRCLLLRWYHHPVSTAFQQWLAYIKRKKRLREAYHSVLVQRNSQVLLKCLSIWRKETAVKHQATEHWKLNMKRKYFQHLMLYSKTCSLKRDLSSKAQSFRCQSLRRKLTVALSSQQNHQVMGDSLDQTSDLDSPTVTLRICLDMWKLQLSKNLKSQALYRQTLLTRHLRKWIEAYRVMNNQSRVGQSRADRAVLKQAFDLWRKRLGQQKIALLYHDLLVQKRMSSILLAWRLWAQVAVDKEEKQEKLKTKRNMLTIRCHFTTWVRCTEQLHKAQAFHAQNTKRKFVQAWLLAVRDAKAQRNYRLRLLRKSWKSWQTFKDEKEAKNAEMEKSMKLKQEINSRICKKHLSLWRDRLSVVRSRRQRWTQLATEYAHRWMHFTAMRLEAQRLARHRRLKMAWSQWRHTVVQMRTSEILLNEDKRSLLDKAFSGWLRVSQMSRLSKDLQKSRNLKHMSHCFTSWSNDCRHGDVLDVSTATSGVLSDMHSSVVWSGAESNDTATSTDYNDSIVE